MLPSILTESTLLRTITNLHMGMLEYSCGDTSLGKSVHCSLHKTVRFSFRTNSEMHSQPYLVPVKSLKDADERSQKPFFDATVCVQKQAIKCTENYTNFLLLFLALEEDGCICNTLIIYLISQA